MRQVIKDFAKQFGWKPIIENADELRRSKKFIVLGMGGSNLTAGLLKIHDPLLDFIIHKDYGLPTLDDKELRERLTIAASYSGNTEETIDGFLQALKKKLPLIAVATGGTLLALAQKHRVPYIKIPSTGIQPRMALGYTTSALLAIIGNSSAIQQAKALSRSLIPSAREKAGKALANKLKGYVPIIYASTQNQTIAYNWKIKFNETGKIPAFYNVVPELNHNEMTGLDPAPSAAGGGAGLRVRDAKNLSRAFSFIFLRDEEDHPRIQKRMRILEKLYRDRDLPVHAVDLKGKNTFHKIFSSLILADWAAFYTAQLYGLEAEQVPIVEEFKRLMAK